MPQIACVDVNYLTVGAHAAALAFIEWTADQPTEEVVVPIASVEPYQPGQFYRRELPCILAALQALSQPPQVIIIDGYVWLQGPTHPGLGGHLFAELRSRTPVIGVAKTRFHAATTAVEVFRGTSRTPLFVTAAGMDIAEAAADIREMHGPHRLPALLKRVDRLCREGVVRAT